METKERERKRNLLRNSSLASLAGVVIGILLLVFVILPGGTDSAPVTPGVYSFDLSRMRTTLVAAPTITEAIQGQGRMVSYVNTYPEVDYVSAMVWSSGGDGAGARVHRSTLVFDGLPAQMDVVSAAVKFDGAFYQSPSPRNVPLLVSQVVGENNALDLNDEFAGGERGSEWEWSLERVDEDVDFDCSPQTLHLPVEQLEFGNGHLTLFLRSGVEEQPQNGRYTHWIGFELCEASTPPRLVVKTR